MAANWAVASSVGRWEGLRSKSIKMKSLLFNTNYVLFRYVEFASIVLLLFSLEMLTTHTDVY